MERREAALRRLEDELADPAMWTSPSRRAQHERHAKAQRAVEEAYAGWEEATGHGGEAQLLDPPPTHSLDV